MALSVRQTAHAQTAGATTLSATFGQATLPGSLLVALLGTGSPSATLLPDTMDTWTALEGGTLTANTRAALWYAATITGSQTTYTFTLAGSTAASVVLLEVTGAAQSSVFDVSTHTTGTTGTNIQTGSAATTSQADEIWIAGFFASYASGGTGTFASITNSFTLDDSTVSAGTGATTNAAVALGHRIVSTTGNPSSQITLSSVPTGTLGYVVAFTASRASASVTSTFGVAALGVALLMGGTGLLSGTGATRGTGLSLRPSAPITTTATGALSSTGVPLTLGTAATTGRGALAGTGQPIVYRLPALAGAGDLAGTGVPVSSFPGGTPAAGTFLWLAPSTCLGSQAAMGLITGTATLTGSGTLQVPGQATPAGSLTLSATPQLMGSGRGTLTASGTLTSSGTPLPEGAATCTGTLILSSQPRPLRVQSVLLSAQGTLSGFGAPLSPTIGTLSGYAALTGIGLPVVPDTESLANTGDLTGTGLGFTPESQTVILSGDLSGTPAPLRLGSATINSAGALTGSGVPLQTSAATGTIQSAGDLVGAGTGIATGGGLLLVTSDLAGSGTGQRVAQILCAGDLVGAGAPSLPQSSTPHLAFDAAIAGGIWADRRYGYPATIAPDDAALTLVLGVAGVPPTIQPAVSITPQARTPAGPLAAPGFVISTPLWVAGHVEVLVGTGAQSPDTTYVLDVALTTGVSTIHFLIALACRAV